jgi:hypothetical protein
MVPIALLKVCDILFLSFIFIKCKSLMITMEILAILNKVKKMRELKFFTKEDMNC